VLPCQQFLWKLGERTKRRRQAIPVPSPAVPRSAVRISFDERDFPPPLINFSCRTQRSLAKVLAPQRGGTSELVVDLSVSPSGDFLSPFPFFIMANVTKTLSAKPAEAPSEGTEAHVPPTARVEFGGVSAAIWPKKVKTGNDQARETWMVTLSRTYRDGNERKRTHTLFPENLLPAAMALIKAWEFTQAAAETEESDHA
jgi:hypothetical protein